ncbi:uncharacterized protein K452DRAFT_4551 [Aplosporella prunicola CBS 121167]|uniref:Uncharacterized protein n=1 Tax=Aplosporella prunicola CBS 121167 TaxID=1176127 RepID=A0A6A6BT29_9PEZI|nr:uncharacterized protein K452DRAFT_4551 [Aplosporella prunicola CBS 121167]KAF2147279.1 hypothetical protein K452DRAFT_4551 [Aplosporella prunicola CBS 121167]
MLKSGMASSSGTPNIDWGPHLGEAGGVEKGLETVRPDALRLGFFGEPLRLGPLGTMSLSSSSPALEGAGDMGGVAAKVSAVMRNNVSPELKFSSSSSSLLVGGGGLFLGVLRAELALSKAFSNGLVVGSSGILRRVSGWLYEEVVARKTYLKAVAVDS